jgi:glycosylphosphatidylinositol transamidase (GPIT) subunit GPI8
MENRKTAMQELFDNLEAIDIKVPIGVKQIFLEKEKEQIKDAYKEGCFDNILDEKTDKVRAEYYYNETYKSE